MLIIEVTNARDVVRQRIGRLGERLIGKVVDPEAQVEKALMSSRVTVLPIPDGPVSTATPRSDLRAWMTVDRLASYGAPSP